MEAVRSDGVRMRKGLSWFLALMLCAQMLGTSAMHAFADEAGKAATAANETLGKNLVYDDVYGVKNGGLALMVKHGSVSIESGDTHERVTQADLVNSSGAILASFGMNDAPSSLVTEIDKANCVSEALSGMERLLGEEFAYYGVPKNEGGKLKFGFASKDNIEISSCCYDTFSATTLGEPAVAALDLDSFVVDVYDASGAKMTSIPMPSDWLGDWSEGPHTGIWFATGEKSSLMLSLSGRASNGDYVSNYYVWDPVRNSFVVEEENPPIVGDATSVWNLPDGGTVTIAEVDGQDACTCTTPQGSFTVDGFAYLWQFDVFVEEGLIQRTSNDIGSLWDLSGAEVTVFGGAVLDTYLGDGLFLCRQSTMEGQQYSLRQVDGTIVKTLSGTGPYRFVDPFICGTDSELNYVVLDLSGNEVKKLVPSSTSKRISLSESVVEDVLVAIEMEREHPSRTAIAAYDKGSGKWLSSEVATECARASRTTLLDGTTAYRVPVYEQDDGTIHPDDSPAYYRYADREMNTLSNGNYGTQAAYTSWISAQQVQRMLGNGTMIRYAANESGKYGAVDAEGTVLIPFEYDAYYDCGDHESLILLKKNGAWEFFDTNTIDTGKEPVPATSVTISGAPEQLVVGTTAQLTATVAPANSTDKVTWASSDESVLQVSTSGLVTAVANGKAIVTATAGGQSDAVEIAVTRPAESVAISGAPEKPLNVGETVQLGAQVKPEDFTGQVTWSSSDENVLTVDADGLVTALGNGEADVTAAAGGKTASVTVTVVTPATGVELDAKTLKLYVGDEPSKLQATVLPATASNKGVAWMSSNDEVVTVDENGAVAPVATGTATITATTLDGGFAARCEVTVGEHVTGITLDKSEASIVGAGTTQLKATVTPEDALDKSVTWSTSEKSVATVDENGLVTAAGKGTATITATTLDGELSASCTITVSNPVTGFDFSAANVALKKGETQTVNVAARGALPGKVDAYDVKFSVVGDGSFSNGVWSDASGKAVFSIAAGANGDYDVAALGTGKGTLVFETQQGTSTVKGVVAVAVTNPAQKVTLDATSKQLVVGGESFALKATVDPADADEAGAVAWFTSNAKVATVEGGVVTPVSAGSATIMAKAGGVSATCVVTVAAKQVAETGDDSAYEASVDATDSVLAKRLQQIAEDHGGTLLLAVQGAGNLTEAAQKAIESLEGDQEKVAEVLDVFLHDGAGDEVSVDFSEDGLSMTVRIRITDAMRALDLTTLKVLYVADDGTIEEKQTWIEGDYLCFTTEHFSTYVVTGSERQTSSGGSDAGSGGGSGTDATGGNNGDKGTSLASTGDTAALPLALAGSLIAAALACLAYVRSGRRMK